MKCLALIGLMRTLVLGSVIMFGGCAAMESPESVRMQREHRVQIVVSSLPLNEMRPAADEIRLLDSRVIRALLRSDPYQNAVFLTGPQKTAIIVGASILGAYLINDWIEDEVAVFPGP
jgi:hypothetical protein